jgi:hypothetical protein
MISPSLLPIIALYLVTLLGDGCIIIAMAVVATMGGSPWAWGASFAAFHAVYSLAGLALATELSLYSQLVGDLFALTGALVLLSHFVHHRLHHGSHGDCRCENHEPKPASAGTMLSTAGTLSIHALAAGPVLQRTLGDSAVALIVPLLFVASLLLGAVIAAIVLLGETQRHRILRALDQLPGVVSTILSCISFFMLFHAIEEIYEFTQLTLALYAVAAAAASATLGIYIHQRSATRNSPNVIHIAPRKAQTH